MKLNFEIWNQIRYSYIFTYAFWFYFSFILFFVGLYFDYFILCTLSIFVSVFIVFKIFQFNSKLAFIIFLIFIFLFMYINSYVFKYEINFDSKYNYICGFIRDIDSRYIHLVFAYSEKGIFAVPVRLRKDDVLNVVESPIKLSSLCIKNDFWIKIFRSNEIIIEFDENIEVEYKNNFLSLTLDKIRNFLVQNVYMYLEENTKFFLAIVFGIQDYLDSEDKKNFNEIGLAHVLVASGANILLVIMVIRKIVSLLRLKNNRLFIELIAVLFYLLLVGLEGSLTRAFLFFIITLISLSSSRPIGVLDKLIMTVFYTVLFIPSFFNTISFNLSLCASFAVIFASDIVSTFQLNKYVSYIIQNFIIVFITSCITAFYFKNFNLTGIFSNLIVLPVIEIIVILGVISLLIVFIYSLTLFSFFVNLFFMIHNLLINFLLLIMNLIENIFDTKLNFYVGLDSIHLVILFVIWIIIWVYLVYRKRMNLYIKALSKFEDISYNEFISFLLNKK